MVHKQHLTPLLSWLYVNIVRHKPLNADNLHYINVQSSAVQPDKPVLSAPRGMMTSAYFFVYNQCSKNWQQSLPTARSWHQHNSTTVRPAHYSPHLKSHQKSLTIFRAGFLSRKPFQTYHTKQQCSSTTEKLKVCGQILKCS